LKITKNCQRISSEKVRKDLYIVKDSVPYKDFTDIYKGITEWDKVPYYFSPDTSYEYASHMPLKDLDILNKYPTEADYQWVHLLIVEGDYLSPNASKVEEAIKGIVYSIFPSTEIDIVRAKVNILTPQVSGPIEHVPHIDWADSSFMSGILYMNDSDGNTTLYDTKGSSEETVAECLSSLNKELEVTPMANTCVVFPSALFHSSSTPSKVPGKARIVINFTFKFKEQS
jgi:hypothetical protein